VANLLRALVGRPTSAERANETTQGLTVTDWARMYRPGQNVTYGGVPHTAWQINGGPDRTGSYDANSVVFALESKRILVFSEARFQWQQMQGGRPGNLFGTQALAILESPWPGATTRDLMAIAELDVATAGNSYWTRDPTDARYLLRLDPNCMRILTEATLDPTTGERVGEQLLGYAYVNTDRGVTLYAPEDICHWKPYPATQFVGRSWISACLPDIRSDEAITRHKNTTLSMGANLGYVVSVDADMTPEQFREFVTVFRAMHDGPENAGKTAFLGSGADVKTVGQTWESLNLRAVQSAGETRIAAASGVHPVVAGLSEGLAGSSLNAGNYSAAKRSFVDATMRPLWGSFAAAMQSLIGAPTGARLWYDDRDIPFLREDVRDQAEIRARDAQTIRTLVDAGFEPDAVVDAVMAGELGRLVGNHSGLYSVQLQPPMSAQPQAPAITQGATP
jgi:phage portal protein BeeE